MNGVWNLSYPKWLKLLVLLSVFSRLYNNLHGIPQDVQAFYFELGKIRGPGLLRFEGGKLMYLLKFLGGKMRGFKELGR